MNKKAVGYTRVSTTEQAQEGLSLAAQEARIRAYCTAKGWELLRVYQDAGISGKSLDRPAVQSLISDLEDDGVDVVVVLKLDRLTRSVRDLGSLIDDLFKGRALATVQEGLDTSTASGEFVLNMLGAVAQWERKAVGERTATVLRYKKDRGEWCGRIPYGFKVIDKMLIEDPEEMANILKMKKSHRRGQSVRKIATRFGISKSTAHKLITTDLRVLKQPAAAIA